MKKELPAIQEASDKINQELFNAKREENNKGSILDLLIGEQTADKLEEEKINAEKIIVANIKTDKGNTDWQLPTNIKKYFGL